MSVVDWTLLAVMVGSGAVIVLGAALLWYVAKGAWRLAHWLRG